jgi:sugar phosphate permease
MTSALREPTSAATLVNQSPTLRAAASILGITTVVQVIGAMLTQSLALLGPELISSLRLSPAQFGLVLSCVNVGMLLAFLFGGIIGDRVDGRILLALSAFCSGIFVAVAGLVSLVVVIEGLLVAAGFAWGVSVPAAGGAVVRIAPSDRRGLFVSIRQIGLPIGGSAAALIVPLFVEWHNWHAVLVLEGALFIAAGAFALRAPLPSPRPDAPRGPFFPARETLLLGIGGALVGAGQWAFIGYLTFDLTFRFRFSFGLAAAIFLAVQLSGAAGRLSLGWVSDRVGSRTSWLVLTSIVSAAGLLGFGQLGPSTPIVDVVALSAIIGFSVMAWNGMLIAAFAEAGPRSLASTSIGAGLLLNRVGILVAPPLFGLILGYTRPSVAWAATAAVLVAGAAVFAMLRMWIPAVHLSWRPGV